MLLALAAAPVVGDEWLPERTLALAVVGAGFVVFFALRHLGGNGFGFANRVTLARGALTAFVLALVGAPAVAAEAWIALGTALIAFALDHVDGRLARSRGEASAFGARFDMETDAVLILGLSVLVWQYDKAGVWVLSAGAMRYAFIACGWLLPWLERPLPPSRRRQAVCVLQTATLLVALVPFVASPLSAVVAGAGLAALVGSFAIDVRWLFRARGLPAPQAPRA